MESDISSRMAQSPFFYSLTIFQIKVLSFSCFANILETLRYRANITIVGRYEVWYFTSNAVTANVTNFEM